MAAITQKIKTPFTSARLLYLCYAV